MKKTIICIMALMNLEGVKAAGFLTKIGYYVMDRRFYNQDQQLLNIYKENIIQNLKSVSVYYDKQEDEIYYIDESSEDEKHSVKKTITNINGTFYISQSNFSSLQSNIDENRLSDFFDNLNPLQMLPYTNRFGEINLNLYVQSKTVKDSFAKCIEDHNDLWNRMPDFSKEEISDQISKKNKKAFCVGLLTVSATAALGTYLVFRK